MRPDAHFTADGWINDPHGFVVIDGEYHVFFQYVPGSTEWETGIHWGHAVGPDVLSLTLLGSALEPGDGDDGIWTGSIVTADDRARAFYTAVVSPETQVGRIRVATAADQELRSWQKGPVVVDAPEGLGLTAFRDPFVFDDDGVWRMLVGGAMADGVAGLLSYSSSDLRAWHFDGVAASRSSLAQLPIWTGELWECPQLISVDGHDVLVFSVWAADTGYGTVYALGRWSAGRFDVERWGDLAYGASPYAPTVYHDASGRPCITFWLRDVVDPDRTWAGAHSLPWVLSVVDGTLRLTLHGDATRHLRSVDIDDRIEGACVIRWSPRTGEVLEGHTETGVVWTLQVHQDEFALDVGSSRWSLPRSNGPAALILDGPVLELTHDGAVLAAAVAASDAVRRRRGAAADRGR
ncbi:beta-fructofuranosidase [Curtobacterium sp. 9128]|uniref:glycoside hydrolase family 32 protein n=1 Tax=Curtobacterium sp. 9128 TaxID=1793722 RepID=UPI0007D718C0|nr:glycoside hydrolase family 32 protein [Curtobacterium sp. 9128]SBN61633.1 beta-fructofuranosidase [Curtobacterium sp. 9128]